MSDWDRIANAPLHPLYGMQSVDSREIERCRAQVTRLRAALAELLEELAALGEGEGDVRGAGDVVVAVLQLRLGERGARRRRRGAAAEPHVPVELLRGARCAAAQAL